MTTHLLEERLRLVVDSLQDYAVITLDRGGRITSWNTGAQRIFGHTQDEALNRHIGVIFTAGDRDASIPQEEMLRSVEQGRADDERWYLDKWGRRLFVSATLFPLRDNGTVNGYVKVGRDVTSRKYRDDAMRLAHEEMEDVVRARTEQLQALFQQLVTVQEDERRRIAREIHDELGQQMTALRMALDALSAEAPPHSPVALHAARAADVARGLDQSIDALTWDLRPVALEQLGLSAAIEHLVRDWSARFGVAADYQAIGLERLNVLAHVEINLYRIVQEALHNVHKHARARNVAVVLESSGGEIKLMIEDDGVGFDLGSITLPQQLGLISMRERATLLGGEIDIESSPGGGTTVYVRVPGR